MPKSEASSAWEVLSKDDPHSSPSPVAFPTSPTSPTFPPASGSAAIKGPTETITERLAKVSLGKSAQPLPQGHQVRNVSGGSVDSGSSAWGTLASKSILSGSKAKKDKEERRALKEEKKEKGSSSGTKEKSERTKKERSHKEDKALEKQRDTRPKAEVVEKVQPAQPESTTASSSIVHVAVPSSSTSDQPIINSSADHNRKPRRSRKGKNARANAGDIVTPEPALSDNASVVTPSSAPTALELWSEVQSQPALSSAAGISVTDMSIVEMSSQHRKAKRHRNQKPVRSAEGEQGDETASQAAMRTDARQDLTVTEMVMQAKARARRGGARDQESSRRVAEDDEENQREKRRIAQREKRNRAAARKQAERQAVTGDYDQGDRVPSGLTGGQGRPASRSGNEDNFRADSASPAQSFRLVRGTSDTSRGTSGTPTDSGVLLSDGSMNRNETRGIKQTTASSSRATGGGGGSSSAMYTHTKSSADPLYSGYLVVEPPSTGSSRTFGTISNSNESVAPHHSISRRGSFDHSAGRERDAPTTTVIIGLERLDLNARRDPSVGPAGKQAGQVKSIQQPKHKGSTPVPPPRPHSISNTLGSASTRPSAYPHQRHALDETDDAHSITSYEEAHSSVRAYLDQDPEFLADPKNQLVFWQGLCVELGLALPTNMAVGMKHGSSSRTYSEASDEEHVIRSTTSKRRRAYSTTSSTSSARTTTTASDRTAQAADLSRSSTPRPVLPPVPTSKTACLRLLKAGAHINLSDWFEVRPEVNQRLADLRRRRGAGAVLGEEEMEYVYEPLRRLMFPSPSAMIRYTCKHGKFVGKKTLKAEWLEPLMKDMHLGGQTRRG
ncbi:hypothetical protein FFLO_00120 [Filobasidium floriforme]|uniref:Uncharacterized protein n=1 Tax=Filobasidium floriforme TaxID=5210 RepID=A0A8K0NTT7_9TREE|nr:hypothetical protein FFLO_00120 [Filobasidium floriforme]